MFTWVMLIVLLVLLMLRLNRMFGEPASIEVFGVSQASRSAAWTRENIRIIRAAGIRASSALYDMLINYPGRNKKVRNFINN